MLVHFDWDPAKARSNLLKHCVSFDEAAEVFEDPLSVTVFDGWHSEGEVRWASVGASRRHRLLVVFHTHRGGRIRLISARLPTANERLQYEEERP
ncbi:MAG TPA: BrnT family toxin [Vicinamibacterales bacterium]|nr:BrnT family toxin [Vicinamibacterales bacterium]